MLQQTRVAAVLEHYAKFMNRFPSVDALARAREQSVLAAWSGLGYYHRARRMHQAAKVIVREHGGQFPSRFDDWLQLPGIGRYTAAAIASIAFAEPVAVVDGNVERVLARLDGAALRNGSAWDRAQALLAAKRPGDFNQAMMELGATICTPRAPQCGRCPLSAFCRTRGEHPLPKPASRKRKQLFYALVEKDAAVMLVRRASDARLLAGMWELPQLHEPPNGNMVVARLRHSITDTDYEVSVFRLRVPQVRPSVGLTWAKLNVPHRAWFSPQQWKRMALTGLARKILTKAQEGPALSRKSRMQNPMTER